MMPDVLAPPPPLVIERHTTLYSERPGPAPIYPAAGESITLAIKNSSGGSMGTITWNSVYKLAGSFTNPANGKIRTITFYYDGTNWIERSRAAADIG